MEYEELVREAEALSCKDKLRLAQTLMQMARREEAEQAGQGQAASPEELVSYVAPRIRKLRPTKKAGLINSINAMFQFQGGLSAEDLDRVLADLQKQGLIRLEANNRVVYP